jgi:hypothetical protein
MTTQSQLEQRVMANVGVIYTARKVFSATAVKAYVLLLATLALWRLVWVTRVEQNFMAVMHGGLGAVGNYALYALVHTHLAVQATLAVAAVAFVMLVVDLARSAATPRLYLA